MLCGMNVGKQFFIFILFLKYFLKSVLVYVTNL